MSVADVPLGPIAPRCAAHPAEPASGTCTRCGGFFCAACRRLLLDKVYCASCAERPDVNYLEGLRLKLWGKRDTSAWTMGVWALVLAALGVRALRTGQYVSALGFGICAGLSVAFFLGMPWSRKALIITPLIFTPVCALLSDFQAMTLLGATFACGAGVYSNPRNQLFFRLEVPVAGLQKLWHHRENNPVARHALGLAAGALMIPLLAPVAIILAVIGLRRVNPQATPPVERRAEAIGAIVLSVLAIAAWSPVLWPVISSLWHYALR
jgi:cytochrome c oxidase subunit IV